VDCGGECHADVIAEQAVSVHGPDGVRRFADADLPSCAGCHGDIHTMTVASDPSSPVHESRQGETCGACHGAGQPAPPGVRTIRPIEAYTASAHAHAVAEGVHGVARTCRPHAVPVTRRSRSNSTTVFTVWP
jgi:hypothetical protein